jgi:hypothetical protein
LKLDLLIALEVLQNHKPKRLQKKQLHLLVQLEVAVELQRRHCLSRERPWRRLETNMMAKQAILMDAAVQTKLTT